MDWTSVVYWLRLTMIIIDAYTQEKFIMSDGKLRAGIIGLGVGQSHAKGYLSSPDTELVAVCDANETRLNEWADLWKIEKRYTDYTQMLDDANLDIVSVCLPNALHAAASIAALDRGVHVVCEKPMAQWAAFDGGI
jgi:UDP-N-acetylglucosamine 3-dehydrogenase